MSISLKPVISDWSPSIQDKIRVFFKNKFSLNPRDPDLNEKVSKLYKDLKDGPLSNELKRVIENTKKLEKLSVEGSLFDGTSKNVASLLKPYVNPKRHAALDTQEISFTSKESEILKEALSTLNFKACLPLLDLLGFEIFRQQAKIIEQIANQTVKDEFTSLSNLVLQSYSAFRISFWFNLNTLPDSKKLSKLPWFMSSQYFRSVISEIIKQIDKSSRKEKKDDAKKTLKNFCKLLDVILDITRKAYVEVPLLAYNTTNFENLYQEKKTEITLCLDDLILLLSYYMKVFSHQGYKNNFFIELNSIFKSYKKEIQNNPPNKRSVKLFYEKIRALCNSGVGTVKFWFFERLKGESLNEENLSSVKKRDIFDLQCQQLLTMNLKDILDIIETQILQPHFPKFITLSHLKTRFSYNIMQLQVDNQNLLKKPEIQYENGDLTKLFTTFRGEVTQLFIDFYGTDLSFSVNEMGGIVLLCLTKYTLGSELKPHLKKIIPYEKELPHFLDKLTVLREKHLDTIKTFFSHYQGSLSEKNAILKEIKEFYFNESLPICRFVMMIQDVRAILRYEKRVNAILNGESILLPDQLVDFMDFDGLEDAAEKGNDSYTYIGIKELFEELEVESTDSDDEDENVDDLNLEDDDDEKENTQTLQAKKSKKTEAIDVNYDTSGITKKRTKPDKSHKFKRRKILERLHQRQFFGSPGKGSHQTFATEHDEKKKTTVPGHTSIKRGTLRSIEKISGPL